IAALEGRPLVRFFPARARPSRPQNRSAGAAATLPVTLPPRKKIDIYGQQCTIFDAHLSRGERHPSGDDPAPGAHPERHGGEVGHQACHKAPDETDHAAAPPSPAMNSRRLIMTSPPVRNKPSLEDAG